jgi:hypothetical protein
VLLALIAGLLLVPTGEIRVAPRELRLQLVKVINADRVAAGLPPVEYSEELSEAADGHCLEMLEGDYASHWNRAGWKPYLRYAAAGIRDATSENIHAFWSTDFREEQVWQYVVEGHRGFMAEQPPNDGHRRSVLGERHTHVGIGIAYDGSGLRLIELFGGRYAVLEALPLRARLKENLTVGGRLLRTTDKLLGISVYYEPLPRSMNRAELRDTFSYSLPKEERMERPRLTGARYVDGSTGTVNISGRNFQMPLYFWKDRPGVYTIAVWIDPGGKPPFVGALTCVIVE